MKSYQLVAANAPLELVETETPEPQGTEVLVRVTACGVCHSDLHFWHGFYDLGDGTKMTLEDRNIALPFTMGHEPVGEVVAYGPDVETDVKIGETRLVFPWTGCGDCARCDEGNEQDCADVAPLGVRRPGGYADHIIVPHPRYLVDIEGVDPHYACTLACAGVTAFSALKKAKALAADDKLVIIGAGGVGLTGVGIATEYIANEKIVVDLDEEKLAAAREAGADHTINPKREDASARVAELTVAGAGAVVDFVGSTETVTFGMEVLRRGGSYILVGLYGGRIDIPTLALPTRDIALRGSYVGNLGEMHELMALVKAGKVDPIPVASRPMSQVTETLKDLEEGRIVGRMVVVPDGV
ncbi:MAG: alcohol dehydrogenase [Alphaproteobacteria bacterium]|jgi:D-arabinose 1-dehydrogenase-like Zn-dependent alcohol dehydrogenase